MAKVASAASIGSSGVSSAITSMPASRAFSMAGTMAFESLGVIRMPLAPAEIRFSIGRDLALVVAVVLAGERPQLDAELVGLRRAPSFILTKNGLVLVLVIRPTIGLSAALAAVTPRAIPSAAKNTSG